MSAPESRFKNVKETAEYFNESVKTVRHRVSSDPTFPRPFRMGRFIKFKTEELDVWVEAQRTDDISAPANWHYPNRHRKDARPATTTNPGNPNE